MIYRFAHRLLAVAVGIVGLAVHAGTITYFHNDLAGSPVAATNEAGQVIWRESYRPYGERLVNSPAASANKVWFTSRRQDVETGLVYMGARYYDPVVGRFMSMDPAGFDEKNLHSFNRYAYANNNPYRYVDPTGAAGESIVLRAALIVGVSFGLGGAPQTQEQKERNAQAAQDAWRGLLGLTSILSESVADPAPKGGGSGPKTSNPIEGEPGSCSTCNNSKGEKKQDRIYGPDGWPVKDIDYDHDHKGDDGKTVGKPHAHDWGRPAEGGRPTADDRGPARPLRPDERG